MGDSISRAEAVSLLWKLKQVSEKKTSSDIPYIHFNMLLIDPAYREEIIASAEDSGDSDLQEIATRLRVVKLDGRLIKDPSRVQVSRAGKRETQVTFLATEDVPDQRIVKAGARWLAPVLMTFIVLLIIVSVLVILYDKQIASILGAEVVVTDSITEDTRWQADNTYILNDLIYVESGASLTIDPGVIIKGRPGSALIVTRNSQLYARGTRALPIVMTSAADIGDRQPGDWGGLVLLGNAPVNQSDVRIEGLDPVDPRVLFGGVNEADSCGVLEFVRVEYAGSEVYAHNALNGLTMGGCGNQTVIRHVQVHLSLDDGVQVFGGNVDLKHLVISGPGDDGLDWDMGWQGRVQFLIVQQHGDRGDSAFEGDNNPERPNALPGSRPVIFNATLIGGFSEIKAQRAMVLRQGTGGHFANVLMTGFTGEIVDIRDVETVEKIHAQKLSFESVLMFDIGPAGRQFFMAESGEGDDDAGFDEASLFENQASIRLDVNPGFGLSVRDVLEPEFSPHGNSVVELLGSQPPEDEFWEAGSTYIGALPAKSSTTWLDGWTSFSVK